MNALERSGAAIGVVVFAFGIGVGWNALNDRIDRMDEKIASIQKTLGSTTCTAILTRQIEAIEKGRAEARTALEKLSGQYNCVPQPVPSVSYDTGDMNMAAVVADNAVALVGNDLDNQLEAVDALLNNAH